MEDLQGPELMLKSAARHGRLGDLESRKNLEIYLQTLRAVEALNHDEAEFRRLNQENIASVQDMLAVKGGHDELQHAWKRVTHACHACHDAYQ